MGVGNVLLLKNLLPQPSPDVPSMQAFPHSFQFHPSFPFSLPAMCRTAFCGCFPRDSANSRAAAEGLKSLWLGPPRDAFPSLSLGLC